MKVRELVNVAWGALKPLMPTYLLKDIQVCDRSISFLRATIHKKHLGPLSCKHGADRRTQRQKIYLFDNPHIKREAASVSTEDHEVSQEGGG